MLARIAPCNAALLLLLVVPATSLAQDAAAVLNEVRQTIGKEIPLNVRIAASGSGYAVANGDGASRQHFGIDNYTQQLDLTGLTMTEQVVRRLAPTAAPSAPETRTVRGDSPWPSQYLLWTTPFGFLVGASKYPASVTGETFGGAKYQVVTFTVAGQRVRGFVNDQKVLERTRTEFQDPTRGKVEFEAIYRDWTDFNGVKAPTMIIQKENDQLSRVLIVHEVAARAAAPTE
jgi:hypothetical protein